MVLLIIVALKYRSTWLRAAIIGSIYTAIVDQILKEYIAL